MDKWTPWSSGQSNFIYDGRHWNIRWFDTITCHSFGQSHTEFNSWTWCAFLLGIAHILWRLLNDSSYFLCLSYAPAHMVSVDFYLIRFRFLRRFERITFSNLFSFYAFVFGFFFPFLFLPSFYSRVPEITSFTHILCSFFTLHTITQRRISVPFHA